jgi:hypothetical protein
MPSPIAPTPPIPTGLPPNPLIPPMIPFAPMPGRDGPQTLGAAVLDAYGKAVRSADLRGKLDRTIADTSSFPFYVLDKLDKWLRRDHVPWFGDGQGGKQIQPLIPGTGSPGTVAGATYIVAGSADMGYGQMYNGSWKENFSKAVVGPLSIQEKAYNIDGTRNGCSLSSGTTLIHSRGGLQTIT